MHAKAFHHAQRTGNSPIGHRPQHHVGGLKDQGEEVPGGVVGGGRLGDLVVWLGLDRLDQVGEFDSVLDELEH